MAQSTLTEVTPQATIPAVRQTVEAVVLLKMTPYICSFDVNSEFTLISAETHRQVHLNTPFSSTGTTVMTSSGHELPVISQADMPFNVADAFLSHPVKTVLELKHACIIGRDLMRRLEGVNMDYVRQRVTVAGLELRHDFRSEVKDSAPMRQAWRTRLSDPSQLKFEDFQGIPSGNPTQTPVSQFAQYLRQIFHLAYGGKYDTPHDLILKEIFVSKLPELTQFVIEAFPEFQSFHQVLEFVLSSEAEITVE